MIVCLLQQLVLQLILRVHPVTSRSLVLLQVPLWTLPPRWQTQLQTQLQEQEHQLVMVVVMVVSVPWLNPATLPPPPAVSPPLVVLRLLSVKASSHVPSSCPPKLQTTMPPLWLQVLLRQRQRQLLRRVRVRLRLLLLRVQ